MTDTTPERPEPERYAAEPARVLTLTDGVVAIAMTLLALDLKPPADLTAGELGAYLRGQLPAYAAFLLAFVLIAQFWVVHHRMLRDMETHDLAFTWTNMLFLLGITLLPLVTFLIGEDGGSSLATTIYAADLLLISAALGLLRRLVHARGMLHTAYTPAQRRQGAIRTAVSLAIPALVIVVAWLAPGNANYLFFLYAVQEVPGRIVERRRARRAPVNPG